MGILEARWASAPYLGLQRDTTKPDMSLIYPVDPTQLPKELTGVEWPPKGDRE